MEPLDIIDRCPHEFGARLECDKYFIDIPVVVQEQGDIEAELARKQAVITSKSGKRGVAVVVLQIIADDFSNNLQFGPMRYYPAFQVIENVELNKGKNGTGKSARKVARRIRDVIKNCNMRGLVQDMKAATPCIKPVKLEDMPKSIVSYEVNFECLEVSTKDQTQVQDPQFTVANNQLAMTCPTVGAEIWFTLDDSFPYNGDKDAFPGSTAQLYTGPITPADGTIVRACAYLDGAIASGIPRATIKYSL